MDMWALHKRKGGGRRSLTEHITVSNMTAGGDHLFLWLTWLKFSSQSARALGVYYNQLKGWRRDEKTRPTERLSGEQRRFYNWYHHRTITVITNVSPSLQLRNGARGLWNSVFVSGCTTADCVKSRLQRSCNGCNYAGISGELIEKEASAEIR